GHRVEQAPALARWEAVEDPERGSGSGPTARSIGRRPRSGRDARNAPSLAARRGGRAAGADASAHTFVRPVGHAAGVRANGCERGKTADAVGDFCIVRIVFSMWSTRPMTMSRN